MSAVTEVEAPDVRVVDTDELMRLMAEGYEIHLPEVTLPGHVREHYDTEELEAFDSAPGINDIVSIEYVGEEEVQCISIEDERHLYITDDFIPTHNTSNIVFLKSTDDSMIETLQKMSGTKHTALIDSKTITKDVERIVMKNEGKVSYTMNTKEEPVISYNDMAFISERNSIVYRAGDSPIWNRNETILPMSWRLFKDSIEDPGKDYSLQTIPTLSSALEFDVRRNQPNFIKMLGKRMVQATRAEDAKKAYQRAYGYSEYDISTLDPDVYADEVMGLIEAMSWEELGVDPSEIDENFDPEDHDAGFIMEYEPDDSTMKEAAKLQQARADWDTKRYADKALSRGMFLNDDGSVQTGVLSQEIIESYKAARAWFEKDGEMFVVDDDGSLLGRDGSVYISKKSESESLKHVNDAAEDEEARVFAEEEVRDLGTFEVNKAFYELLLSMDDWDALADGRFDHEMSKRVS